MSLTLRKIINPFIYLETYFLLLNNSLNYFF